MELELPIAASFSSPFLVCSTFSVHLCTSSSGDPSKALRKVSPPQTPTAPLWQASIRPPAHLLALGCPPGQLVAAVCAVATVLAAFHTQRRGLLLTQGFQAFVGPSASMGQCRLVRSECLPNAATRPERRQQRGAGESATPHLCGALRFPPLSALRPPFRRSSGSRWPALRALTEWCARG